MTNSTAPITAGIHHLGLTVSALAPTVEFFISALGFKLVKERPDYPAAFVSDGKVLLTLWQAQTDSPTTFDRKVNLGLHHFALVLPPEQSLDEVAARLAKRSDVEIEFMPEALGGGPTRHLMCAIPGGLRMELVSPGGH